MGQTPTSRGVSNYVRDLGSRSGETYVPLGDAPSGHFSAKLGVTVHVSQPQQGQFSTIPGSLDICGAARMRT